ncbi:hypothetical protein [Corallococcus sp. RDP092CA]|uniref:hypothetical protein n=1 Tax=Corallococcus sp. RDP092CA TaxID=3109369 RepID=UPI0035B38989
MFPALPEQRAEFRVCEVSRIQGNHPRPPHQPTDDDRLSLERGQDGLNGEWADAQQRRHLTGVGLIEQTDGYKHRRPGRSTKEPRTFFEHDVDLPILLVMLPVVLVILLLLSARRSALVSGAERDARSGKTWTGPISSPSPPSMPGQSLCSSQRQRAEGVPEPYDRVDGVFDTARDVLEQAVSRSRAAAPGAHPGATR